MVRGVRTPTAKLIERTTDWPSEFYDLARDPGEKQNLIDQPASKAAIEPLRADLRRWFMKIGAPPLSDWRGTTKQHLTEYSR
jgi:hypothetical protein